MTVPYTFGTATTSIPLSNLDANFNTPITLGNTSIYLGNTTTTIGNLTLTNATISSGNVTLTNVSVTTANVTNITVSGTANIATGNVTTLTSTSITDSGLTSGRVTFAGASGLLSDSASFTYNGTNLSVNGATITGGGAQIAGGAWSVVPYVFNSLTIDNSGGAARFFATGADASTYGSYIWYGGLTTGATSQYMTLTTSGRLGIGNSTPDHKLDILNAAFTSTTPFANILSRVGSVGSGADASIAFTDSVANNGYIGIQGNSLNFASNTTTPQLKLDSSGNLGLGVTPSPWQSSLGSRAIQFTGSSVYGYRDTNILLVQNAYLDSATGGWKYYASSIAAAYSDIGSGAFGWFQAASGTAGGAITFTQTMTLDASGELGIGTTSPISRLQVSGSNTYAGGGLLLGSAGAVSGYLWTTDHLYIKPNTSANTASGAVYINNFAEAIKFAFDTNTGNAGFGTSSPNSRLQISDAAASSNAIAQFTNGTTGTSAGNGLYVGIDSTNEATMFNFYNSAIKFGTNGSERMRIDSSGQLLLGTTSNTTNGGIIFAPDYNGAGISNIIVGHKSTGGNGNQYMIFNYNGTGIGSIAQDSTTGVLYNVTSDQRLKTNIVNAPSGNIDGIKVRSFDWLSDGNHQEYGMVAQELIEVAPYAVHKPENPDEMMGVDYSKLVPMIIKEIQDLKAEVNQLKAKIGV